ncbi:hypothetical protein TIFTF001_008996 [Ficus carica]|uniref:Uncharacterized protein n=1 Tax=Ficus carica TaxID=3494 RepID=A0AA87ZT58_FICCA|nr:hypothetical protein TIFTF001_008996 [Ficus carica]
MSSRFRRSWSHDGVPLESRWPTDVKDRDTGMIPIHVDVLIPVLSPSPSTVVADRE